MLWFVLSAGEVFIGLIYKKKYEMDVYLKLCEVMGVLKMVVMSFFYVDSFNMNLQFKIKNITHIVFVNKNIILIT